MVGDERVAEKNLHQKRLDFIRAARETKEGKKENEENNANHPEDSLACEAVLPRTELPPAFENNAAGADVWYSLAQSRHCPEEVLALIASAELGTRQAREVQRDCADALRRIRRSKLRASRSDDKGLSAVAEALEGVSLSELDAQIAACALPAMKVLLGDVKRQKLAIS